MAARLAKESKSVFLRWTLTLLLSNPENAPRLPCLGNPQVLCSTPSSMVYQTPCHRFPPWSRSILVPENITRDASPKYRRCLQVFSTLVLEAQTCRLYRMALIARCAFPMRTEAGNSSPGRTLGRMRVSTLTTALLRPNTWAQSLLSLPECTVPMTWADRELILGAIQFLDHPTFFATMLGLLPTSRLEMVSLMLPSEDRTDAGHVHCLQDLV